jgi:hypothetical protein
MEQIVVFWKNPSRDLPHCLMLGTDSIETNSIMAIICSRLYLSAADIQIANWAVGLAWPSRVPRTLSGWETRHKSACPCFGK